MIYEADMAAEMRKMEKVLIVDEMPFRRIVIDTACGGASVISQDEYQQYCRGTNAEYDTNHVQAGWVSFGNAQKRTEKGRVKSLGMVTIRGAVTSLG